MSFECIVFSDPRSTVNVQIATREGSQATLGQWTGTMKFSNLNVVEGLNRNSTATFTIYGYNTVDSIDNWMLPGIAIFVVRLGHLRFSGVISKVDGSFIGSDGRQTFNITCESCANWLVNQTQFSGDVIYKQQTAKTILMGILSPDTIWYDQDPTPAATYFDDVELMDYTITAKPRLTQIQELASISGMKYRVRTKTTRGAFTGSGYTVTMNSRTPDDFFTDTSGLAYGTHNKYILVLISGGPVYYHNCVFPVVSTNNTNNSVDITTDSSKWINNAQFFTGRTALLIQHPILEFQKTFALFTEKILYVKPTSSAGQLTLPPCWNYSPLSDKNDVITKVVVSGNDCNGLPITCMMSAAFKYDPSDRKFILQEASNKAYVDISYESNILYSDLILTGGVYKGKIQVFSDTGISWSAGSYCYLCQTTGGLAEERAYVDSVTNTGEKINGRPTIYLLFTAAGLSYPYFTGDIITWADQNYQYSKIQLSSTSGITDEAYYWIGNELVKVKDISSPNIYVARGRQFTSLGSYTVQTRAIAHKAGCPVVNGMPVASESTKCFDRDDYYGKGLSDTSNDAPVKKYGINTKHIHTNKVTDMGTLEIICHNLVRNLCLPKYKGDLECYINSLISLQSPYNAMKPGDVFQVNYFGTTMPGTSLYYQIMEMDMNFDYGTCKIKFDEYDVSLEQYLQQLGLSINIA